MTGHCGCHVHEGFVHSGLYPYPTVEMFEQMPPLDRQVAGVHVRRMLEQYKWELTRAFYGR
jgi:hypothetical protein